MAMIENLERLAGFYDASPTLDAVADAIIRDTVLTVGQNERDAVMGVLAVVVNRDEVVPALEHGDPLMADAVDEMARAVERHNIPVTMPPGTFVEVVVADLRKRLRDTT